MSGAVEGILRRHGVRRAPVRVVYDGVPAPFDGGGDGSVWREAHGFAPDDLLVVAVGALVPHKGHGVLVDAIAELPGVHAVILGRGPLAGRLGRQAVRRGVADRVHLLGWRDDVAAWMASADVVCHPSLEEGLGSTVLDALRAGSALVASRVGGIPEAVEGLGVLVPPGRPRALAAALRQVLADPGRWRRKARAAAAQLERRFSVQTMVAQTWAAYACFAPSASCAIG